METIMGLITIRSDVRNDVVLAHQTCAKETKSHESRCKASLKRGDKVITIGGIHGTIDAVDEFICVP